MNALYYAAVLVIGFGLLTLVWFVELIRKALLWLVLPWIRIVRCVQTAIERRLIDAEYQERDNGLF